jgi:hypothetical protein
MPIFTRPDRALNRLTWSPTRGSSAIKISNRKIAVRLPRLCSRQVERRVIPDYRDLQWVLPSAATGQLPTRGALDTPKWRG